MWDETLHDGKITNMGDGFYVVSSHMMLKSACILNIAINNVFQNAGNNSNGFTVRSYRVGSRSEWNNDSGNIYWHIGINGSIWLASSNSQNSKNRFLYDDGRNITMGTLPPHVGYSVRSHRHTISPYIIA